MFMSFSHSICQDLDPTYLFGDDVLTHFPLHFLEASGDGRQLGGPHRLVEDLLAVSTEDKTIKHNRSGNRTLTDDQPHFSCGILSRETGSEPNKSSTSWHSFSWTSSAVDKKWSAQMHTVGRSSGVRGRHG